MLSTKPMLIGIVLLLFLVSELLFSVWCRMQCVRLSYEITDQTKKQQKLLSIQNNLKIEMARLKSPERIVQIATKELGLIMPNADQTVTLP